VAIDRAVILAAAILACGGLVASCGGSSQHTSTTSKTTTTTETVTRSNAPATSTAELLSIPAVGRIYGTCKPGAPRWPIRFVVTAGANDFVTYRIGAGHARSVNLDPGRSLTLQLIPGQYRSRQPADPVIHSPAQTIRTTLPVTLSINQGTEPHIYRVNITFALAAAIGDTSNCALVSSTMRAFTYYPGGQPAG
jgi:hypothetical protein